MWNHTFNKTLYHFNLAGDQKLPSNQEFLEEVIKTVIKSVLYGRSPDWVVSPSFMKYLISNSTFDPILQLSRLKTCNNSVCISLEITTSFWWKDDCFLYITDKKKIICSGEPVSTTSVSSVSSRAHSRTTLCFPYRQVQAICERGNFQIPKFCHRFMKIRDYNCIAALKKIL